MPGALLREVRELGLNSVALTYNEPTLQAEYVLEAVPMLREAGVALVLVTNGAMSRDAADAIIPCLGPEGAANIDIKAFTDDGYRKLGGDLKVVKNNIAAFVRAGIHVELTHLVVPGVNGGMEEFTAMTDWVASLSRDIPLHISRYFPMRSYVAPPTNIELMNTLARIAKGRLRSVYLGNV
jgi:pyruvate formate lyase activating enzyme